MAQPCTLAHRLVAAEVTREQGANKLQRWEGHEGQHVTSRATRAGTVQL